MAIQKEIWVAEIAANLFKDNMFLRRSRNDDAFVEGKVTMDAQAAFTITLKINFKH